MMVKRVIQLRRGKLDEEAARAAGFACVDYEHGVAIKNDGEVFKMSVDGNNTAPGHEDYFGVQEYIGTYDAEKDTFNVSFMLNDYEELMEYNAERISPIYATVDEMMFVGTYINYHLSGNVMFKIISYGNGMCEFYIGTNAYTDLRYTAQGNEIRISLFGLMMVLVFASRIG